jgi:D-alanine transaminase
LANWNGEVMPLADVRVPALDRAFLFGDAVYEAMRVYAGRIFLQSRHADRLDRSLTELKIVCDTGRLWQRISQTLDISGVREGFIYTQISRGSASHRSHAFPGESTLPNELFWIEDYEQDDPYANVRAAGVSIVTFPDLRWARRDIKTVNLLGNCLASQAAKEAGAYDALLVDSDGRVNEGSHTSAFAVRDGQILTSPQGQHILPGVTRGFIIQLAERLRIPLQEEAFRERDLPTFDEIFLTGTSTEVLAVTRVNGWPVGDSKPGAVTRQLAEAYRQAVRDWLAGGAV